MAGGDDVEPIQNEHIIVRTFGAASTRDHNAAGTFAVRCSVALLLMVVKSSSSPFAFLCAARLLDVKGFGGNKGVWTRVGVPVVMPFGRSAEEMKRNPKETKAGGGPLLRINRKGDDDLDDDHPRSED
jgi:hypothetical protein